MNILRKVLLGCAMFFCGIYLIGAAFLIIIPPFLEGEGQWIIMMAGALMVLVFGWLFTLDTVIAEFEDQVSGRDRANAKRYLAWLDRCIKNLDTYAERAVSLNSFEKLTGTEFYSIRYPRSKKNPRVLYFFICDGVPVLLYAFLEKSSSDYTHGINVAKSRAKFVRENWPRLEVIE